LDTHPAELLQSLTEQEPPRNTCSNNTKIQAEVGERLHVPLPFVVVAAAEAAFLGVTVVAGTLVVVGALVVAGALVVVGALVGVLVGLLVGVLVGLLVGHCAEGFAFFAVPPAFFAVPPAFFAVPPAFFAVPPALFPPGAGAPQD